MCPINKALLLVTLACILSSATADKMRTAYKYHEFDEETEVHLTSPFLPTNNKLGYAVCELDLPVCEVFIETYHFDNTSSYESCDVGVPMDDYVEVTNFVGDRIALYWVGNGDTASIQLVNVRRCVTKLIQFEVAKSIKPKNIDVVLHENTVDIFYKSPEHLQPISYQRTYNYKGKMIEGPIRSPDLEYHGVDNIFGRRESYRLPIQKGSSDKGYYCLYESDVSVMAFITFPDLKKKELFSFPHGHLHDATFSSSNELFGICYQYHQHDFVTCTQWNAVGTMILNTTYELPQESSSVSSMRMHNLENGGFLMVTGRCHMWMEEHCTKFRDFYVQKFENDEDKLYRKVKVRVSDELLRVQDLSMYEDGDEFCLFAVFKNSLPLDVGFLHTVIKCFPKRMVERMEFI